MFFVYFLPDFCRKSYEFLQKTRIKNLYFLMFRQGMSSMNGSSATPSLPEPNPFLSTGGRAWRPYADSTGNWRTTKAGLNSMPTIWVSTILFILKIIPCLIFRVHFKHGSILRIVLWTPACRYEFLDPDSNRIPNYFSLCVWIRIRTVFQIIFHSVFGSGFEPYSTLASHFKSLFVTILGPRIFLNHIY